MRGGWSTVATIIFPISRNRFVTSSYFPCASSTFVKSHVCHTITTATTTATPLSNKVKEEDAIIPKNSADLLRKWGCTESEVNKILIRQPGLHKADVNILEPKLRLLGQLGLKSSDLVKIIHCRPKFLSCRISQFFDERLEDLESVFGSKEILLKAIVRNPSILTYDFHATVKPVFLLYEQMGISKEELIPLILTRPTLIKRTQMNEEKLNYIHRTGLSRESKMYKYVVAITSISRIETIREKIANFEKFGFSEDEVLDLFGRCPVVLTLSIDKVQRHMTFVLGTMQLPAKTVLRYPFLLYFNLEALLKPRVLLARKIEIMGLVPQVKGPGMFRALRMNETRFVEVFINCHPKDLSAQLLEYYRNAKGVKRLAEASKTTSRKGFPL